MIKPFVIPVSSVCFRYFTALALSVFFFVAHVAAQSCELSTHLVRALCINDDPSGPSFYASIQLNHSLVGAQWIEEGGRQGRCNQVFTFGPFPLADTTLVFHQAGNSDCTTSITLSPPACAETNCSFDLMVFDPYIDDNGTPGVPEDDVYYTWIRGTVNNPSSPFFLWLLPDTTLYDDLKIFSQLGPFPVGQNIPLVITDLFNPQCSHVQWITSPLPDSSHASISGRVWFDNNANGIRESGEPSASNIEVNLFRAPSDERVVQVNTSSEVAEPGGMVCVKFTAFNFLNLRSLSMSLSYDTTKLAYLRYIKRGLPELCQNCINSSTPGRINVNWGGDNGGAAAISLPQGVVLFELCFQVSSPGAAPIVLNQALPLSYNALLEPQPVLFFQGGVNLPVDATSAHQYTIRTDAQGQYTFDSLLASRYLVKYALPDNHRFSIPHVTADSLDSDVVVGVAGPNDLGIGAAFQHVDAGMFYRPGISGRVWIDANRNSQQDPNEGGAPYTLVKLKPDQPTAQGPTIYIENEAVVAGQNKCITVFAEQLTIVNGIQFGMLYNPEQLRFTGATNFNLPWLNATGFSQHPGEIGFSWVYEPLNGFSRIARAPIFSICFDVLESGNSSLIFGNQVFNPEYVDIHDDVLLGLLLGNELYFTDSGLGGGQLFTTSHDGRYSFDDVPNGAYTLEFIAPDYASGFAEKQAVGVPGELNSDASQETGRTPAFFYSGNVPVTGFDAGLWTQTTATLQGQVYRDSGDCSPLSSGQGLANRLVRIRGVNFEAYRSTDAAGHFECSLLPGTYVVSLVSQNELDIPCQPTVAVEVVTQAEVFFSVRAADDCPLLEVNVGITQLRRCTLNTLRLHYHNLGVAMSPAALLSLDMPDGLVFESASLTPDSIVDGTVYWGLGNLPAEAAGSIQVVFLVDCNLAIGASLCVEARITPILPCPAPNASWTGAELRVTASCIGDQVKFTLTNVGTADMDTPISYIVIEDGIMLMQQPLQLLPLAEGQEHVVYYPANGSTYRLEASQEAFFPFPSLPSASIEGCGVDESGAFSTGFVGQFPMDDEAPYVDIDCHVITGDWAFPEKQAQPEGYGSEHYTLAQTRIDYTIRFQNTIGDSLHGLEVRDTLSPWLDLPTLQLGASSHPYQFSIDPGRVLVFSFPSIMLPDSTVDVLASQGFVKFSIQTTADIPTGTIISNIAHIHTFSEASPLATNNVFHTIDDDFILVVAIKELAGGSTQALRIYPNPTHDFAWVELTPTNSSESELAHSAHWLNIRDAQGRLCITLPLAQTPAKLDMGRFASGLYFFEVINEAGRVIGQGRLIRQE